MKWIRPTKLMMGTLFLTIFSSAQSVRMQGAELAQDGQIVDQSDTATEGFRLSIRADKESFSPEEPIQIQLRLRNVASEVLLVKEVAAWYDYTLEVVSESGQRVPLTEKGQKLESMLRDKRFEIRVRFKKVKPGEELRDSLEVRELYRMTQRGTYSIRAKRNVYRRDGKGSTEIVSNTVKVRVVG